jgi:hypothetical protein
MCFFDSYSKSEKILSNRVSVYGAFCCLVLPSSFSSKVNINKKTRQEPCFNQPLTYFVTKRWAYWFLTLCKQSTEAWRWANCFNFGEPELFKLDLGDKISQIVLFNVRTSNNKVNGKRLFSMSYTNFLLNTNFIKTRFQYSLCFTCRG